MEPITLIILILWYLVGVCSFIYWWIKDFDLGAKDFLIALVAGLIGPFAWGLGWIIHNDNKSTVIMKKRN